MSERLKIASADRFLKEETAAWILFPDDFGTHWCTQQTALTWCCRNTCHVKYLAGEYLDPAHFFLIDSYYVKKGQNIYETVWTKQKMIKGALENEDFKIFMLKINPEHIWGSLYN